MLKFGNDREARQKEFKDNLRKLINLYALDKDCETPDFIVTELMMDAYKVYKKAVINRDMFNDFNGKEVKESDSSSDA